MHESASEREGETTRADEDERHKRAGVSAGMRAEERSWGAASAVRSGGQSGSDLEQ